MTIKEISDSKIRELFNAGGIVRFSLLSVAACEGREQTERVNRICGIKNKDRTSILIEAIVDGTV